MVMSTIARNDKFILFRKKFQRPKGGSKNMFIISPLPTRLADKLTVDEQAEVLNTLKTFNGREWGSLSAVFRKRVDAEKAWIFITLRWG
jgi:hypothetical protein